MKEFETKKEMESYLNDHPTMKTLCELCEDELDKKDLKTCPQCGSKYGECCTDSEFSDCCKNCEFDESDPRGLGNAVKI